MQGKLALAAGFVAGYVLGSKAGRQRYEEIVAQARKVAGNQTVQSTAGVLQAQATDLVSKAKQNDLVSKAVGKVKGGGGKSSTDSSTTVTSSTYSTPPAATYTSESESFPTPSTTGTTDLFEPRESTIDPLAPVDPLSQADPLSQPDPLSPNNPSNTNGSNP